MTFCGFPGQSANTATQAAAAFSRQIFDFQNGFVGFTSGIFLLLGQYVNDDIRPEISIFHHFGGFGCTGGKNQVILLSSWCIHGEVPLLDV